MSRTFHGVHTARGRHDKLAKGRRGRERALLSEEQSREYVKRAIARDIRSVRIVYDRNADKGRES